MRAIVARGRGLVVFGAIVAAVVALPAALEAADAPKAPAADASKAPAASAPKTTAPDLCAKEGSQWSKGVVTKHPWKVISNRNSFEVKYCIVRETATNKDEAIVRYTNVGATPLWLKVRTFYKLSSGRQVEQPAMVSLVKPKEFALQSLPHSQTKPGEQVKELGFHEMQVSSSQLR